METASDLRIVLTTWPADGAVDEVAATLVRAGLAACVSIQAPMVSHYRWAGAIEHAEERQVVIKTTASRVEELEARLHELHPYEVPELLVLDAAASAAYGGWVRSVTER